MSILITGINGFVGKNLSQYLHLNNLKFKELDVKIYAENEIHNDIKTIIHLAGKAHDLHYNTASKDFYNVNFELTKKLYTSFLNSNAQKFIYISSIKAAVDQIDTVLTEEMPANPQTHYGKSKLMAEKFIQNQPLPLWKSYYILRPCIIHGPGNKGNLNLLFQFIKRSIPYPLAAFANKRSFLSIENLCFVIKELMFKDNVESGIYQIADDEPLSTNEVLAIFASSSQKQVKLWAIPPVVIKLFAKIGDWCHLPLTTERLEKLTENFVVSNARIKKVLKIEMPLSAVEGLKVTAAAFENSK